MSLRNRGVTKRNDQGLITLCDGRAVDAQGKFVDTKTDVFEYLQEVADYKANKVKQLRQQQRERQANITHAYMPL